MTESGTKTKMPVMTSIRCTKLILPLIAAGLLSGLLPGFALAQGTERLGDFGNWSAFRFYEGGKAACYIASEPTKAEGKYKKRGEIFALVSHWPSEQRHNEVSFLAGYSHKENSTVSVNIDGKVTKLFTDTDRSYAADRETDEVLVKAMKRGARMVVQGVSRRGTKTKDSYSLNGFTKALQSIDKACPKT